MLVLKDFRKKCEDLLNNSGLPIDAIYYVLKDVFNEVTDVYNQEIQKEEMIKKQNEDDGAEELKKEDEKINNNKEEQAETAKEV